MNRSVPRVVGLCAFVLTLSCSLLTTEPDLAIYRKGIDVSGITIRLEASPSIVTSADSIEFRAWARNHTDNRIQVGESCGPSMDAVFSAAGQSSQSALHALLGPDVAFTCELGPYHFAEPRDSLLVRIRIGAPSRRGSYRAIAGARRSSGLSNLSPAIFFSVQ